MAPRRWARIEAARLVRKSVFGVDGVESIEGDVVEAVTVGEVVVPLAQLVLQRPAGRLIVDVPVLHRRARRLVPEIPVLEVVEPGGSTVSVDHVEHFIGIFALHEDEVDPPSCRGEVCRGRLVPGDTTRRGCCGVQTLLGLVDECCRLVQLIGGSERVRGSAA